MSNTNTTDPNLAATVHHSGGSYPVVAGWDILDGLGERLADVGVKGAAYIITDDNVMNPYGRRVQRSLEAAGVPTHCFVIPSGESSKSFELAQAIYGWLAERRAERGHTIVSVGGGVPGDLGGFVAATYLRGMAFVQVPTSMAAMVDASIGGKVAINLPQAKNLVGLSTSPRASSPTPRRCPRWASGSWPRAGPRPSSTASSSTPNWWTSSRNTQKP